MVYVILLDDYQGKHGDENYAVTFSGTLEECEEKSSHDGNTVPWLKADYDAPETVERVQLSNGANDDDGWIVILTPAGGDAVPLTKRRRRRLAKTGAKRKKKPTTTKRASKKVKARGK